MILPTIALLLALGGTLAARSFTDISGKVIEAEFVSLTDDTVTISKDGHPFKLPLARFSKSDQEFIAAQPAAGAPSVVPARPATSAVIVNGKEITRDGTVNIVEAPLSAETLKKTRKYKDLSGIKLGIALPANFDPNVPWKFLWTSSPINSEADRTAGNIPSMGMYASTAIAQGWAVISVDSNLGNPRREDNVAADADLPIHHQAVAMLSAAWPSFSKSTFACAGYSGGSKASFYRVGQLATANLHVSGLFLGGCNEDKTEDAKKETNVRSGDLRQIKLFVSNGTTDTIATMAHGKAVGMSADKAFGDVRVETFEGGHNISQEQLKTALTWFSEPAKPSGK
jgi:hypothetical protein